MASLPSHGHRATLRIFFIALSLRNWSPLLHGGIFRGDIKLRTVVLHLQAVLVEEKVSLARQANVI